MTFTHALVVGKFYPPHVGHERLIRAAAAASERITVVIAASSVESITVGDRVEWLGWSVADLRNVSIIGVSDEHPIDYEDDAVWGLHTAVFRAAAAEAAPGVAVDAVFSGEDYGEELARRFGAAHVRVDRSVDGVSGTRIRGDLAAGWDDLLPAAREGLARRIVVVGAESTGTTTLAGDVARSLRAGFVPEWGRTYSAAKLARSRARDADAEMASLRWTSDEFTAIASRQHEAIRAAARAHALVIADTDALATSVWHERYVGGAHEAALELSRSDPPHLYVLTSVSGVPFSDDGLRDGEHIREWMSDRFREVLQEADVPWFEVHGSRESRVRQVLERGAVCYALPQLEAPLS